MTDTDSQTVATATAALADQQAALLPSELSNLRLQPVEPIDTSAAVAASPPVDSWEWLSPMPPLDQLMPAVAPLLQLSHLLISNPNYMMHTNTLPKKNKWLEDDKLKLPLARFRVPIPFPGIPPLLLRTNLDKVRPLPASLLWLHLVACHPAVAFAVQQWAHRTGLAAERLKQPNAPMGYPFFLVLCDINHDSLQRGDTQQLVQEIARYQNDRPTPAILRDMHRILYTFFTDGLPATQHPYLAASVANSQLVAGAPAGLMGRFLALDLGAGPVYMPVRLQQLFNRVHDTANAGTQIAWLHDLPWSLQIKPPTATSVVFGHDVPTHLGPTTSGLTGQYQLVSFVHVDGRIFTVRNNTWWVHTANQVSALATVAATAEYPVVWMQYVRIV